MSFLLLLLSLLQANFILLHKRLIHSGMELQEICWHIL